MRLFMLLAGMLLAAPAFAQAVPATPPAPGQRPPQPVATVIAEPVALMIAAFDRNGDAKVSRAEFDAGVDASFKAQDKDGRGSLGYIGFSDWAETWLGDRNSLPAPFEVDTDGDNRITPGELQARFALFFARFDTNKDGVLVRSELVMVRTPQLQMERGRPRRDGNLRPPQ